MIKLKETNFLICELNWLFLKQ